MKKTKVFCLALCLALLLAAMPFALGEAQAPAQTRRLRLGSSIYTIEIDASFKYGAVTEEDVAEGQVAYMYSDRLAVDFDVYQRGPGGDEMPLAEYVAEAAAARGGDEGAVTDGVVNGIPAGWYRSAAAYDGVDYQTVTYVLDDGEDFVEITFWLDGEDAEAVAQGMINTLDYDNLAPVRLGSSPYWVFCSASFREGGMTSEDVADNQVAYWVSDETLLDFDVYQFSKEGLPQQLADYVAQEAANCAAEAVETQTTVNDIPLGWYRTVEPWEGQDYQTLTCVLDAGEEYVVIVFWLDGLTAGAEADAILKSLWVDEEAEAETTGEAEEPAAEDDAAADEDIPYTAGAQAEEAPDEAAEAMTEDTIEVTDVLEGPGEDAGEYGDGAEKPAEANGEAAATQVLRLGTSPFTLVVPAGFTEGEMTQEDIEDDQVAYYYSNETLLDFDVYQFSKDGYPNDLADYVQEEISGFNDVSELVTDGEINGVPAAWYRTVETYQEAEFNTLTYILDGGSEYVELCFWLDGETADAEASAIIRTLESDAAEASLGGEGAVVVDAIEETTLAERTSADGDGTDAVEAPQDAEAEAVAPGDGPDAVEAYPDSVGE